jgi:hypothetical protein
MAASPSTLNYFVGKGTLAYTETGGTLRSLGNCPSFKVTPTMEFLEHFSSMGGVKEQDDEILIQKTGQVEITLDEITLENLALVLFGTIEVGTPDEFEIMAASAKTGLLTLTGTNDKGNQFLVTVNKVSWRPDEGVDFISEEFGVITLTGKMLKVAGSFGTVEKTADGTL